MKLKDFTISPNETIMKALLKIDKNKKGFLVVLNEDNKFVGTLTDGDIRRAFIKGISINDMVQNVYNPKGIYVYIDDEFSKIITIFQNESFIFLPILDKSLKLKNIITKPNIHVLLLGDYEFDLTYDFLGLDAGLLEHEIYYRPWGIYKTTFLNEDSQSKVIKVNPQGILSLQEHKQREEYWVIISGYGEVTLGESIKNVAPGDFVYIPKACKHRLRNTSESEHLMIAEVQLGNYFGEDDIVRYEDVYGRK